MTETRFAELIQLLAAADVEFILVGGLAARVLGSSRITQDMDVVYRRTPEDLSRIVSALAPHKPYPRGAPPGLPFRWDKRTLDLGLNFTLETALGFIDLLGEVTGGGGYEELARSAIEVEAFGVHCKCVDLETLIHLKRAAGRPKDFEAVAELEQMRDLPQDS